MPEINVNTALIALIGSMVGWLMRDLSRRFDGLPARVVDAWAAKMQEMRVDAMTEVRERFTDLDRRMERLTRAQELTARVELLRMLTSPETPPPVKRQAETMLREMDGNKEE